MARYPIILALIFITFCIKQAEMEQIPRQVPELFPRVCGIHGWKKCGTRRRSSVQVTGLINLRKERTHLINVACWGVLGFITTRLSIKMKNSNCCYVYNDDARKIFTNNKQIFQFSSKQQSL